MSEHEPTAVPMEADPEPPQGDELEEALPAERETPDVQEGGSTPGPPSEPSEAGESGEVVEEAEEDPLEAAQRNAAEMLALAQRTQADFENFRKRMARENAGAVDRGVSKLAKELLTPLDHLELALQAAEQHGDGEIVKGIRLVQEEFAGALNRAGIQPFSPKGEPFDPSEHEAMVQQPAPEGTDPGTVLEVYQQGYRLNGAVLRPARVVVAA